MITISSWQAALLASWSQVWLSFSNLLPSVLGAVIVFAIGLILSYWAKRLVTETLHFLKLEKFSKSWGVADYLNRAGIKLDLTTLLASLVEWLIILVFFLAIVDILGLRSISQVLSKVLSYIPNIIAAALILGVGYVAGGLVDGVVRGIVSSFDHKIAKPIGKFARGIVILISFLGAVDQLQIAKGLVSTFFQGLSYTLVLVIGLSVGLGAKDVVAKVLNDWYEKINK